MLRCEPIADVEDGDLGVVAEGARHGLVRLDRAENPPSAVEPDEQREWRVGRRATGGDRQVQPGRDVPCGTGDEQVAARCHLGWLTTEKPGLLLEDRACLVDGEFVEFGASDLGEDAQADLDLWVEGLAVDHVGFARSELGESGRHREQGREGAPLDPIESARLVTGGGVGHGVRLRAR